MSSPESDSDQVRPRRRGAALEAAILDAGWDELAEAGYAGLTMGSVAKRARTSEAVLYRRWANKSELVLAILVRNRTMNAVAAPDLGTLRDDLFAYLRALSEAMVGFYGIAAAAVHSGLLPAAGTSPAQIRERVMGGRQRPRDRAVYRQAAARGEIDLRRVPESVLALPFDLVRHDMLLDLTPISAERLTSIIDEIFFPLLRTHTGEPDSSTPNPHPSDEMGTRQ